MPQSGTKLVIALVGLALMLGAISWWYRYEAAHRASQFWGPAASRLIAESEGLEVIALNSGEIEDRLDISKTRGQAHLRHALMSDRNYVWDEPLEIRDMEWRWTLRFHEGEQQALIKFTEDLKTVGRVDVANNTATTLACEPMAASLKQYFEAIGLLAKPQAGAASTATE